MNKKKEEDIAEAGFVLICAEKVTLFQIFHSSLKVK